MADDQFPPSSLNDVVSKTPPSSTNKDKTNKDNDDDISVATETTDNHRVIRNHQDKKEYVVKFLVRPKKEGDNTEVARTHFAILKTIAETYPDTTDIYDNFGVTMKEFEKPKSYDSYLRHFKLQYVKGNKEKKRNPIYLVFHRMNSSVPISELKKHSVVAALLQKVNTRMTNHLWNEDETTIANLGFYVTIDPGNKMKEQTEGDIRDQIALATKRPIKKIPRFQCAFSSPYQMQDDGTRVATKSYDIQCRQNDAKELIKLLQSTYKNNPIFIFHKLRHTNQKMYTNAIRKQNAFLSQSRVVPIQGINDQIMYRLDRDLLKLEGVVAVHRHKETATKGRWSIMTTQAHFNKLVTVVKSDLGPWAKYYANQFPNPDNFPPASLAFKSNNYEEESEGSIASYSSYASSCDSMYSNTEGEHDEPPPSNNPAPQAWTGESKIPEVLDKTVVTQANSGISQDAFDEVQRENKKLTRQIDTLTSQVQQLIESQKQRDTVKEPDFAMIIKQAAEAAVQSMLSQQKRPTEPKGKSKRSLEDNKKMSIDTVEDDGKPTSNNE